MERRLDARLREIPPPAFHELVGRICAVDEFKGWWRGRASAGPSALGRLREEAAGFYRNATIRFSARSFFAPPPADPAWGRRAPPAAGGASPTRTAYADLLRSVHENHRDLEFGQDLILWFHENLFRHSAAERSRRGRFRTASDRSSFSYGGGMESVVLRPVEPHMVPREMETLVGWTAAGLRSPAFHPLLVIASFQLEFLAVRPFADGNARMGRVLASLLLRKSGYEHLPYFPLDRLIADLGADYFIALRRAQAKRNLPRPDITPWLRVFLDVLQAQSARLGALLAARPREDLLSGNQRAALDLFDRHREAGVRLVRRELDIPRDTAKQVLSRLLELGLIRRTGAGRATRYVRTPLSDG